MTRTYNIPAEAAMGHAETLYPEYRKKLKTSTRLRRHATATAAAGSNARACPAARRI